MLKKYEIVSAENTFTGGNKRLLLSGVFLLSFSVLALEVALTRFLSAVFSYHYVFIVVSIALLGLGTGAIFIRSSKSSLIIGHNRGLSNLARFAGLSALSVFFSLTVMALFPLVEVVLFPFLLFMPFFFAGMFMAESFRTFPALSHWIYAADLIGAGAGSVGVVFSLNIIGGPKTVFLLGVSLALVSLIFAIRLVKARFRIMALPFFCLLSTIGLLWAFTASPYFSTKVVRAEPSKEINYALSPELGGGIIETRWSAFGRTDLVSFRDAPELMTLYIDGTAGTPMYRFNGLFDTGLPEIQNLKNFPGYLPFQFLNEEQKDNALIIGPGGGRDVLLTLMSGVEQITAVEVNRDFVDIVKDYAWYNGGIYNNFDNVSVYVDEGRSFLRRQKEKYDVILLSLPVTKTSRSREGYALTESFLFTTDSIKDYFEHLTDEGRLIVVTHSPEELYRLLSVSTTALEQLGIDNSAAMQRVYMMGSESFPVFVMGKSPLKPEEMVPLHKSIHQLGYDLSTSFLPGIRQSSLSLHTEEGRFDECSMLNPVFTAIEKGNISLAEVEVRHGAHRLDLRPVSDNNPFFYKFEEGIPGDVSLMLQASIGVLLFTILLSLIRGNRLFHGVRIVRPFRFALLFSFLGIGFMLAEVSLFQKFTLFLGQPALSLVASLVSLLTGAGLGSLYSRRVPSNNLATVIPVAALAIAVTLVIYALGVPFIFNLLLGQGIGLRLFITVFLLVPLGFIMGFPFPLGMRLLQETGREAYIPWAWGINGIASMLGSVMTIVIAISFGFTEALLTGAAFYLSLFLLLWLARSGDSVPGVAWGGTSPHTTQHGKKRYYFCSPECETEFVTNPLKYKEV
ncbi:MAG: hypothetical protein Q8O55_09040 [Dehalococcoidales bacterium]|nr:hypothetical protein [Dehalococcoidales bacterium]